MNFVCQRTVSQHLSKSGGLRRGVAVRRNAAVAAMLGVVGSEWFRAFIVIGVVLGATRGLQAEHARIDLRVIDQKKEVQASSDEEPPAGGRNEPPVLKVGVNKPLVLQFIFTNTYPHKVIEHVRVRYYVVRVAKRGRKPPPLFAEKSKADKDSQPLLEPGVVTKGLFTMDFKPDCRVGTRVQFQITEPGLYSARVETLDTDSDHEHFSAIDLVAE